MARYFPVAPVHVMQRLNHTDPIRGGCLLLAHDIVDKPDDYRKLLSQLNVQTIILDNSVVELGTAVDVSVMQEAVGVIREYYTKELVVALPDVYLDGRETVHILATSEYGFRKNFEGVKFMAIPQGPTMKDFAYCAQWMAESISFDWWGIPRNLANPDTLGSREKAIELCNALRPTAIHMLGFSNNIVDDILCARHPSVYSVDSSVPFRAAYNDQFVSLSTPREHTKDWWDMKWSPKVAINVATIRRWINTDVNPRR